MPPRDPSEFQVVDRIVDYSNEIFAGNIYSVPVYEDKIYYWLKTAREPSGFPFTKQAVFFFGTNNAPGVFAMQKISGYGQGVYLSARLFTQLMDRLKAPDADELYIQFVPGQVFDPAKIPQGSHKVPAVTNRAVQNQFDGTQIYKVSRIVNLQEIDDVCKICSGWRNTFKKNECH
jgi:hypothetical protein